MPVTGGAPELLHAMPEGGNGSARGVAVDGGFVYWVELVFNGSMSDGRIMGLRVE